MAKSVEISHGAVSHRSIQAAGAPIAQLAEGRFDEFDTPTVYIDGIRVVGQMIVGAMGLDAAAHKHLLGLKLGDCENALVVNALLSDLVKRGIRQDRRSLFMVDGANALRRPNQSVYGETALIQRCRTHKLRNLLDDIADKTVYEQTETVMRTAFKLRAKECRWKLQSHAAWLKTDYADAAASLLEGIDKMFTANDLGLTPALTRCLTTTNIVDYGNGASRVIKRRVSRWRNREVMKLWSSLANLKTERCFTKILGQRDLWILPYEVGPAKDMVDRQVKAA